MARGNSFSHGSVPNKKEQILEFFKQRDINGDNLLSKSEVKKIFEDLESRFPGIRTWQAMRKADANGDGNIDQNELEDLLNFVVGLNFQVKA